MDSRLRGNDKYHVMPVKTGIHFCTPMDSRPTLSRGQALRGNDMNTAGMT